MKQSDYYSWLHKNLTEDNPPTDALQAWIDESPENQQLADDIDQIWELSANYEPTVNPEVNVESAFAKFQATISSNQLLKDSDTTDLPESYRKITVESKPMRKINWMRNIAASLVLIAASMFVFNYSFYFNSEILTAEDTVNQLTLVDQSNVFLNKGAHLKYYTNSALATRKTVLKGEAFFEIESNDKPFIVETAAGTITVLGTKFNVESTDDFTIVKVKEGQVRLSSKSSNKEIILTKNMAGHIDRRSDTLWSQKHSSFDGTDWFKDMLHFENMDLVNVFAILERSFDVKFDVSKAAIKGCVFTSPNNGKDDITLESILVVLKTVYDLEISQDTNNNVAYTVSGGTCDVNPILSYEGK